MHTPVLLHETIELLGLERGDTVLDGTVGGGGHGREICERIGEEGTLVALDLDEGNLARAEKTLADCSALKVFARENFRNLNKVLRKEKIQSVDAVLLDLGLSSFQLDSPAGEEGRGFSFRKDETLTMTFKAEPDAQKEITARDVVNEWSEETLTGIFKGFGEERHAKRIAHAIAQKRSEQPIERTGELAEIVRGAAPKWANSTKVLTRIFQAIRMAVNDELGALKEGLPKAIEALAPGGGIAVISFHSGEDRIVKRFFKDQAERGNINIRTKRPTTPSEEEIAKNPRARSAKLRAAEKTR